MPLDANSISLEYASQIGYNDEVKALWKTFLMDEILGSRRKVVTIIDLISIVSDSAGGVDVIRKHFTNSTPEALFKKSFVDAVKQLASSLAHVADPKTIKADKNRLDQVLASLKDSDLTELVLLNNIRIKGTRIGIETLLYEVLHLSKTPEEIVQSFDLLTWKQVYATILYYLQNPIKIGGYLADNLQYSKILREEYEKNPPPGVVRLRQLKAESDDPQTPISKNKSATTASLSKTEQE